MSEALISKPDSSVFEATLQIERLPTAKERVRPIGHVAWDRLPSTCAAELTTMPALGPGQLWFIGLPSAEADLSALEQWAITNANVVIYDRVLTATVAQWLPLGGYAEAVTSGDEKSNQALDRCLRFSRDGWSVARLEARPPRSDWGKHIRHLSEQLLAANASTEQSVLLFRHGAGGKFEKIEARLGALDPVVDACSVENRPTIVFGQIGKGIAPSFSVASCNGLAG